MKKKCKHLIDSTKGWPKKLVEGCFNLEQVVEQMDGLETNNSGSDFQPSYVVYKTVGDWMIHVTVDPRIRNEEVVYMVRDQGTEIRRIWVNRNVLKSISIDGNRLGGDLNPHIFKEDELINYLQNLDVINGYPTNWER